MKTLSCNSQGFTIKVSVKNFSFVAAMLIGLRFGVNRASRSTGKDGGLRLDYSIFNLLLESVKSKQDADFVLCLFGI